MAFDFYFEEVTCIGEIVHSDLRVKLPISMNGNHYFLTFIDQCSCYTHVAWIKSKGDASDLFKSTWYSYYIRTVEGNIHLLMDRSTLTFVPILCSITPFWKELIALC